MLSSVLSALCVRTHLILYQAYKVDEEAEVEKR